MAAETICHVLFHCKVAKETWALSQIPLPPGGFSTSSVWLNFYHLMALSKKASSSCAAKFSFPWILWQIWKARNSFCYENVHFDGAAVFAKASEEAACWLNLQFTSNDAT